MNPQEYQALTDRLKDRLESDPRVIGLMAAGSMAGQTHQPDEWSDHDFWVVVQPDAVDWFRQHREWLPDSDQIVLFFRESMHDGLKAVYQSGHLLDFAVSERKQLLTAKVNDYQLLIDRVGLADDLQRLHSDTEAEFQQAVSDDLCLLGQFLTNLLVGVARFHRGEWVSARQFITVSALFSLLRLIPKHIPTEHPDALDNLDSLRRVERAYPQIGAEINKLLRNDLDDAAVGLLDLADRLLRGRMDDYPAEAVAVIRATLLR